MEMDQFGILKGAKQVPSPNFNQRPANINIDLLVIHNISLPPGKFGGQWIEALFTNQLNASEHPYFAKIYQLKVSAHLLIKRTGEVVQFVAINERAWHAGQSSFEGRDNCNDYSIGIELEGTDNINFTAQQYQQLVRISLLIMKHYPLITTKRITGHENIAPGRKTDPGKHFDWQHFFQSLKNTERNQYK